MLSVVTLQLGSSGGNMELTAVFKKVPEGYIAWVEELPGANTQGRTLEETRENLQEAIRLVFEANRELTERDLQDAEVLKESVSVTTL
jgi:predicted RNase H-like HicB family nuclease